MAITVWARDPERVRRGVLRVAGVSAFLRESGVGTWTITVDGKHELSQKLGEGWGILVYEDGRLLFSGPLLTLEHARRGEVVDLTLTGVTDMIALEDRIVYPDPAVDAEVQTTAAYYVQKGPAEDLIASLVNLNAGPGALSGRQTPGLRSYTSAGRGNASSVHARWTSLLEEVQTLARTAGLVVDLAQASGSSELELIVRAPVDRSRSVRFFKKTGLGDYTTKLVAPTASTVIVGGGGQGTARTILERSSAPSWNGRRVERFQDRRDTTDTDELEKAAQETLAENAATASASFAVTEAGRHVFSRDYFLGDTVTVVPEEGVQVSDVVRSVSLSWDGHGRAVELSIGENTAGEERAPAWVRKVEKLQAEVRRIGSVL